MSRSDISINDLAGELGVPGSTLRRYIKRHEQFLKVDKSRKNHKVSLESVETLMRIREAYAKGLSTKDVDQHLTSTGTLQATENPAHHGIHENMSTNVHELQLTAVFEAISRLENMMAERFEQQGEILKTLAEVAPTLQLLNPDIQRDERVNARLNEWRVERKLESDALAKWAEMPQTERMIRTGLFKAEENTEKRERFVREFVDKHFDDEMRKAYGV